MKKRLLLFLCIFTLLLSTAAQAEDVTADVPAPAPSAEKADTLSPFARTRSYDGRFTDVDASATSLTATIRRPRHARRWQACWPPRSARSATTSATPRP